MWLEINDKGKVAASEHRAGENTVFYLVPVGMREVAIQNVASGRYIAINSKGKLFSKESYDQECIFKVSLLFFGSTRRWFTLQEGIHDNYWTTYSSLKWGIDQMLQVCLLLIKSWYEKELKSCTWHMGINCRGHRINSQNSRKNKPACHFIPYPIEGKLNRNRLQNHF